MNSWGQFFSSLRLIVSLNLNLRPIAALDCVPCADTIFCPTLRKSSGRWGVRGEILFATIPIFNLSCLFLKIQVWSAGSVG